MSFDILLSDKYNCQIYLIDPTKRAKIHYDESIRFFNDKSKLFTGNVQSDYYNTIGKAVPNFNKIHYNDIGLWNKKDTLKFFKQTNKNYVSQSLINNMFGQEYDIVEVDTLRNIMDNNKHIHIDLLKLDIEGAEVNVLNQMLDDNIFPKYICVEFDLYLKGKDLDGLTNRLIIRLNQLGYAIIANE
jgi:FkbM family methyltransferase